MVHHQWLRPKTSPSLPIENDSSSILSNQTQYPQLSTRRSTHEFFSRTSLSDSSVATRSTNNLFLSAEQHADINLPEHRIKIRIEEAKNAAAAMVRKALQGSREMRPTDRLSTHDSTMSAPQAGPSARSSSSLSNASRRSSSLISRPLTRFKSMRERSRRNAISFKAGSSSDGAAARDLVARLDEVNGVAMDDSQVQTTSGGSAARASAAEHNKNQQTPSSSSNTTSTESDSHSDSMPHPKKRRGPRGFLPITESGDFYFPDEQVDSDQGVDEFTERRRSKPSVRFDPLALLPTEISAAIFACLNDFELGLCMKVSKKWREIASSPAVWRASFLTRYQRPDENTLPYIQFGGQGLGSLDNVPQEWQRISLARKRIEQNWQRKAPKAIYFAGHTDSVYCCQFDEDKIITGSRDRTIRVWDLNFPYECRKVIGGPAARPTRPSTDTALDTHPTNTVHQSPSMNGTLRGDAIYHTPSDYHTASILCLQFDKEIMVTGSSDHSCIVWDVKTFEPIRRLNHHTAGVLDVCMDDQYIISCSKDAHICVWDRATFTLIKALHGHRGPVNAVQLRTIDGAKKLVSASGDGLAKIWDLEKLAVEKQFNSQDRGLAAVEFSDDGRYVLAGGNDQVIYKFDVKSTNLEFTYRGHSNLVRSLFLDSANGRVVSGSYDQGIRVYDFEGGNILGAYDNWTTSWILAAKSDYRRIVATSQDGRALLMDFGWGVTDVDLLRDAPRNGEGFGE